MLTWRAALLLVVIALAVAVALPSVRAYVNQQATLGELRAEAEGARAEVDDLTAEVARWDDPAYVVAQARERLTFVFPGETPFRVVDAETVDGPVDGSPAAEREPAALAGAPWYDQLWGSVLDAGDGGAVDTDSAGDMGSAVDTDSAGDTDSAATEPDPSGDVDSGE